MTDTELIANFATEPYKISVDTTYQPDYIRARLSYFVAYTCRGRCSHGGHEKERLMNPARFAPFSKVPAMICLAEHGRFLWRAQLLTRI
jgi:hypothetical protein